VPPGGINYLPTYLVRVPDNKHIVMCSVFSLSFNETSLLSIRYCPEVGLGLLLGAEVLGHTVLLREEDTKSD